MTYQEIQNKYKSIPGYIFVVDYKTDIGPTWLAFLKHGRGFGQHISSPVNK